MRRTLVPSLLVLLAAASPVAAATLPTFQKGMWEYQRTVTQGEGAKPVSFTTRKCGDPSVAMQAKNAAMEKSGCHFSPVTQVGNRYAFTGDCAIQGRVVHSKTTIVAQSATAYRLEIESEMAGHHTHEVLLARRVGDCPN